MKTLTITTRGLIGPAWIKRLEKGEYRLSTYAKQLLNSPEWEQHRLNKGETITVCITPNKELGLDEYMTTQQIRDYAKGKRYETPKAEVALLIREALSDDEMKELGVWYVTTFHDPVTDAGGDPGLLSASRFDGGQWLYAYWDRPGYRWSVEGASAFVVLASQSSELEPSAQHSESLPLADLEKRVETLEEQVSALAQWAKSMSSFK